MPRKDKRARKDGSHAWEARWTEYDEEKRAWVPKTQSFPTKQQAEAHETPRRKDAKKRKREELEQLTPQQRRAINVERNGGNHATEARASQMIIELLRAPQAEGFEVRMRSAVGERTDLLGRFWDTPEGKYYEIQVKSCTERNARGVAKFGHVNHYTCPMLFWLHATAEDPPSLLIFHGKDLQDHDATLSIGRSPRKELYRKARVDLSPPTLEERGKNVYEALRSVIEQGDYTPLTLEEHARNMAPTNYVNYHARKEFLQRVSQEGVQRTENEIENLPFSHMEGEKKVRESVACPKASSAGFEVKLNKNSGLTHESEGKRGNRTYTALEPGDFDTLRVFLLAKPPRTLSSTDASADASASASPAVVTSSLSSSLSCWDFKRNKDVSNTEIDSYRLVGYWQFTAEELQRKEILGKRQSLKVFPPEDFCDATGLRKPKNRSASLWTRGSFKPVRKFSQIQRRLAWPSKEK